MRQLPPGVETGVSSPPSPSPDPPVWRKGGGLRSTWLIHTHPCIKGRFCRDTNRSGSNGASL